jgi:steroid delta-isomerase-like uncharacterized protein
MGLVSRMNRQGGPAMNPANTQNTTSTDFVRQLVAAWNSGDVERVASRYARDARMHHPLVPEPLDGRVAIRQFESSMFAAFSDLDWRAECVVRDGDRVAVEFQVRATNTAPLQTPKGPVPATQRRIDLKGLSYCRLNADGEIVEERRYFDSGTLFVQLGLA